MGIGARTDGDLGRVFSGGGIGVRKGLYWGHGVRKDVRLGENQLRRRVRHRNPWGA